MTNPTTTNTSIPQRLLSLTWKFLRLPVFVYIGIVLVMWLFQNRIVFQPSTLRKDTSRLTSPSNSDIFLTQDLGNESYRIHALLFEHPSPRGYALYFHGNGGCIDHRSAYLQILSKRLEITILGVSYSGYGLSAGTPSEEAFYRDSETAYKYLTERYGVSNSSIICFGESMGGAVATRLASKHQVGILALDSTFTSLPDVAKLQYPWLPVRRLLRTNLPTVEFASKYKGITVQTHGTEDNIVPFSLGSTLADSFTGRHFFIVRNGGKHNELPDDEYLERIDQELANLPATDK